MLLSAFAASAVAAHGLPTACLVAERASHGVVFCSRKSVSFNLMGRTTRAEYSIYDYHYRFRRPGGVMHGGQRLIVFRGKTYVGNYPLFHASP
jgi:hypothetical protein